MKDQIKITRLQEQMKAIKEDIAQSRQEIRQVRDDVNEGFGKIEKKLDCYVRKDDYNKDSKLIGGRLKLLEKIVYGLIGTILLAVLGSVISLVLK
jgi:ribosome recycling factor